MTRADVLAVGCRHCRASAGERCTTPSGAATRVHAVRFADARAGTDPERENEVIDFDEGRARVLRKRHGFIG